MRAKTLIVILSIFVAGILIGVLLTRKPSSKVDDKAAKGKSVPGAEITAQDIELVQGREGQVQWRLKAKSADYVQETGKVRVVAPQMIAYVGTDRREVFVRANRGDIDQQGNNLTLFDDIEGRYGHFALSSENFDYIGAMNKVFLKGRVSVRRPDMSIEAPAIEIDLQARELTAAGGVVASIAAEYADLEKLGQAADQAVPSETKK